MNSKNVEAGILLVGPEPPIAKRIFKLFLSIFKFLIFHFKNLLEISIFGSFLTSTLIYLLKIVLQY